MRPDRVIEFRTLTLSCIQHFYHCGFGGNKTVASKDCDNLQMESAEAWQWDSLNYPQKQSLVQTNPPR